ncbi:MAG: hypothetical protein AAGF93_17290 [Cyanobacteria bacterium P01_H01_bin.105]
MLDPFITPVLAAPIAKVILDKLYEGAGSKLGEKLVEEASAQIQKLGQAVWNWCFRGKPGTDKVLEGAAKGSDPELKQIRDYLLKEMENPEFVSMVQPMAQEIHQIVQVHNANAKNVQQNFSGQSLQVNDPKSQVIQAGNDAKFYFGVQPED